jgi:hypothetical protein
MVKVRPPGHVRDRVVPPLVAGLEDLAVIPLGA